MLYGRGEAPFIGLVDGLRENQCLFIVAGTIPNRKSSPVVDEWFALFFQDGHFVKELTMDDVTKLSKLKDGKVPNRNVITPKMQAEATGLLSRVVEKAKEIMQAHCDAYKERIDPHINEELDKLVVLQEKHKVYQLSLFEDERRKSEQERKVDKIFDDFTTWVKDTLEIENNPYIRVIAAMMGGN